MGPDHQVMDMSIGCSATLFGSKLSNNKFPYWNTLLFVLVLMGSFAHVTSNWLYLLVIVHTCHIMAFRAKQLYKYDGSACVIAIKGKQKEIH